jgi:DNA polymerase III delta prime subunit
MIVDEVNKLWVERYRPKTIEDCVLPANLKKTFGEFVNKNYIPNLLLTGRAGIGKTTVARAMLEECGFDYIVINGSMNGNIDTLRTQIRDFASTMSFSSSRKYVILDEADYLNPQSTQPALRNFMEEYSNNCGFIMTCNFKNRIIEPLHSRCSVVDFNIPTSDKPKLATQFLKRTKKILDENDVEYKDNVVGELIMKHFPDWRRVLNELQRYSATGSIIDVGILANMSDDNFKEVIGLLKTKNFKEMRKWVGKNSDIESSVMFRRLYDNACSNMNASTIPRLILILADYGYKSAFCVDQEINLVACLTEIMMECEFK